MYWNINNSLSYNALLNFVIGERGPGKTYGFKKKGIDDFLKNKSQFVYVRRTEVELDTMKNQYFDDIKHNYPDHDFKIKGNEMYIDDEICGWFIALSTASKVKSRSFHNVNKMCFDEFTINPTGNNRYLKNEVNLFFELYMTISRDRDIYVYFLSNALSMTNPYFNHFKIILPKDGKGIKRISEDIIVEMVDCPEFRDHMKQTRIGKLIEGTDYGSYALDNSFFLDNKNFVDKLSKNAKQEFTIKWYEKHYGIWIDVEKNMMYFSYKNNNNFTPLSFTTDDHEENTMLIKGNNYFIKMVREHFKYSNVRFENTNIKNELMPLIERMI